MPRRVWRVERVVERHPIPPFEILSPRLNEPAAELEALLTGRVLDDLSSETFCGPLSTIFSMPVSFHWGAAFVDPSAAGNPSGEFRAAKTPKRRQLWMQLWMRKC
jgi:hypothetical protein